MTSMSRVVGYDIWLEHAKVEHRWLGHLVRRLRALGQNVFLDVDSQIAGPAGMDDQAEASAHSKVRLHVRSARVPRSDGPVDADAVWLLLPGGEDAPANARCFDFRDGVPPSDQIEAFCELLQICPIIMAPLFSEESLNGYGPRLPLRVHELPPAPRFVGREAEVTKLMTSWQTDRSEVIAIIGLGGAGKTALAYQFIDEVTAGGLEELDGLFVWSFYEDPDPNAFLQALYHYASGELRDDVKGASWLHLLKNQLTNGERLLVVLDGLERVQRQRRISEHSPHNYGELEDPLLREFLQRMAGAKGHSRILITTRFPMSDLDNRDGRGYQSIQLDELDLSSGIRLLRYHGVRGNDTTLGDLIAEYGSHALTLDHLGSLLHQYFDGNPRHAPELGGMIESDDPQGHRLQSIFKAYESCLAPEELDVLSRLCIFRFGVPIRTFIQVFRQEREGGAVPTDVTDIELKGLLKSLIDQHLVLEEGRDSYTVHPAVRDHFYHLFVNPAEIHLAVSGHFRMLSDRPGSDLPEDKTTLNHLEELIYHLLAAGDIDEAERVYQERLGGVWHLTQIGEFARGYRILKQFPSPIDMDGLLRFRRGIGDLPTEEEWQTAEGELSFFSANGLENARLLRGQLSLCQCPTARFLQGADVRTYFSDDYAPRFSAILLNHEMDAFLEYKMHIHYEDLSGSTWSMEHIWRHIESIGMEGAMDTWIPEAIRLMEEEERAHFLEWAGPPPYRFRDLEEDCRTHLTVIYRNIHYKMCQERDTKPQPSLSPAPHNRAVTHLWIAEKYRDAGNFAYARSYIEQASDWILSASSQEHLCLLHLVSARIAIDIHEWADAESALEEGLLIAERCRFRLYQVDLLNEHSRLAERQGDQAAACITAEEALCIANEDGCRYRAGAAMAQSCLNRLNAMRDGNQEVDCPDPVP